ncbi:hypothetical protein NBO_7gi002 [Nosema bombycis CQ1]|uniref:Uncharacterized protein n=1 Tax=Nosema bombycis (strain CQ1 / CVCC 102059) TaxID=578461 RepID=R0KYE9_NOSB1|nr:hypothetical protein NBO_7gi002 [Nosema bombycis CQ1]|eukprot:EOB15242.1 hypothetical protein NBO_7gi002 [Nosema bombycis CQ1]
MDLEKPQKEITTEDDTSLFLSKYNIDDNDAGLRKPVEEKKEENSSSFFSMFNFFKKQSYKVDIQASDDIKYDPVTKKWVSGSTQSAPQEIKTTTPKAVPLPGKTKSQPNLTVDVKNMSLYANKKSSTSAVFKKPTGQSKENVKK